MLSGRTGIISRAFCRTLSSFVVKKGAVHPATLFLSVTLNVIGETHLPIGEAPGRPTRQVHDGVTGGAPGRCSREPLLAPAAGSRVHRTLAPPLY